MADDWRQFLLSHPVGGIDSERARAAVEARREKYLAEKVAKRAAKKAAAKAKVTK